MIRLPGQDVPDGLSYDEIATAGRAGWGWSVGGIATAVIAFFVIGPLVVLTGFAVYYGITAPHDIGDRITALSDLRHVTPAEFAFINLTLISSIPLMWACTYLFHGLKPTWLISVRARIRWRWLAASLGVSLVTLVVSVVLGSLLSSGGSSGDLSGSPHSFTSMSLQFLVVMVLLTPLQSAAEEFAFRGYLTQAFGALFRRRWVTVLAPALLFACAHFPQPATAFVDRFAFGVVSGILVIATGGLEAGIAYHVVNNLLAFTTAILLGSMTEAFNPPEGGVADLVVSLVKSVLFVALSIWVARRMGVATRTGPAAAAAELEAPRPRV